MKGTSVFRYISVLSLVVFSCSVGTPKVRAAAFGDTQTPVFTGPSLPVPPRQNAPWQPPRTSLPGTFSTAAIKLFEQGLSDPRGCEYRQVEIAVGSVWGGAAVMKTHAWVLPREAGQRFAVGWNGLVYPVLSVGGTANLQEDILAAIKADEEARDKRAREFPASRFYRFRNAWPEGMSVSHTSLLPLKACLLLRLGEHVLAEQVWAAWTSGMDAQVNDDALHLQDPYLMLAVDWAWARFDRAVCAHMRRDDRLALLDARFLSSVQPGIEGEAEKRSSDWPPGYKQDGDRRRAYLAFLEPLPALLADQERRSQGRRGSGPPQVVHKKYGDNAEVVAALIRELDEASAHQSGQPGGVDMREDATVQALIGRGGDAVEPLLTALEQDVRLTRSVSFHRNFFHQRHLISVWEAAYRALAVILDIPSDEWHANWEVLRRQGTEGRRVVAARQRARWTQEKQVARPEQER